MIRYSFTLKNTKTGLKASNCFFLSFIDVDKVKF